MGPVIAEPGEKLHRALTRLDPGEQWLLEPRQLDDTGRLWRPGIRTGVAPGSFFHRTECFGPVLGLMEAADLQEAIELQNAVEYGLTAGLHSLDPDEVSTWVELVAAGNLYVSLHTADPDEAGDQTTNETAYTNYARVAVARTAGGWTVASNTVSNAALVQFPQCGVTGATLTHFGVGTDASGAGKLLYKGTVTPNISVSTGVTPQLTTATAITED